MQTSQRFFLASWLHSCTRSLRDVLSRANTRRAGVETSSTSSSKSASKRVRELEHLRHQLLSELALTHHLPWVSLPWLSGCKHSGSLVGSSSLSSPSSNKPSRQNSSSHFPGSGVRASSGSTPSRVLVYGGSFLSHDVSAKRFVEYAHVRHMDRKLRLRLTAHAHWSAWQLLSLHPVVPGFEKLFSAICRLVGESSVPVRTKALRSLAAVIEVDPRLFLSSATKNPEEQSPNQVAWLRDLPRLVHARLLDNSASVREAAVDLVSKLLVLRPRALSEYYPMLAERVLDKGVSVRKRAIRCFRDLLVVDWNGNSVGASTANPNRVRSKGKQKFILMTNQLGVEMCIKLIRRLHDEESIQVCSPL
ncbi:Nipped-B protein [Fasciolopsis buskii]|uniref:Nipped-B protein n=1 Tax=Fasciolopsis buskii TaxID=27845 RepID=A0A8E0VD00_9TREM|nr:Nipped-B protein [Fasciolopsis buski]